MHDGARYGYPPRRLGPRHRGAGSRWSKASPRWALLAVITAVALPAGCTAGPPEMSGVRSVPVDSLRVWGAPAGDELDGTNLTAAVLRGPHYTLGIAWIATGDELTDAMAMSIGIAPVRAAAGEQLLLAAVDPEATYAAFDPTPEAGVTAEVVVDGTATQLARLPLPRTQYGIPAYQTELLVISARPDAPVQLRVNDAGRSSSLDLRTGQPTGGAEAGGYLQRHAEVKWDGETPVTIDTPRLLNAGTLAVDGALLNPSSALLTTYRPERGWAAAGRAYLTVSAPTVSFDGFPIPRHAEFDDAEVFAVRLPDGTAVPAATFTRDIDLLRSQFGSPQAPVLFDVPADLRSGTVVFDLGRARLTEEAGPTGAERVPVSWARAPQPFELPITLEP